MVILFILGAFGIKAAVGCYIVWRAIKWLTDKGNAIKQEYQNRIDYLQSELYGFRTGGTKVVEGEVVYRRPLR